MERLVQPGYGQLNARPRHIPFSTQIACRCLCVVLRASTRTPYQGALARDAMCFCSGTPLDVENDFFNKKFFCLDFYLYKYSNTLPSDLVTRSVLEIS
jgi:hypothetical protein